MVIFSYFFRLIYWVQNHFKVKQPYITRFKTFVFRRICHHDGLLIVNQQTYLLLYVVICMCVVLELLFQSSVQNR